MNTRDLWLLGLVLGVSAAGCGDGASTKPDARTQFVADWRNESANAGGITRAWIRKVDAGLSVHMWGGCHPEDCDWGEIEVSGEDADDGQLSLIWDQGYALKTQAAIVESDGRLRLDTHCDFVDPSRADYDETEWFFRSAGGDTEAPDPISDLRVAIAGPSSITLAWTAPHDRGPSGQASGYDLRYGTAPSAAWDSLAQAAGEPSASAAGTTQTMQVAGLLSGTTYAFRLQSVDQAGNWSIASNTAIGETRLAGAQVLVATKETGIWYSSDARLTWNRATLSDSRSQIGLLAGDPTDPSAAYACSGVPGWTGQGLTRIYRSDDRGRNWQLVSSPTLLACTGIQSISVSPAVPGLLVVGTKGHCRQSECNDCLGQAGGVYRSTDAGLSWADISQGLPAMPLHPEEHSAVHAILMDPDDSSRLYVGMEDLDQGTEKNGLFVSTDSGSSWAPLTIGVTDGQTLVDIHTVAVDPQHHERSLACTNQGIYMSEDAMASWSKVSPAAEWRSILFDPRDSDIVYIGSDRSTDGGRTWSGWTVPAGALADLDIDPTTGQIYAVGTDGVFTSTDGGTTWANVGDLSKCTDIMTVAPPNGQLP